MWWREQAEKEAEHERKNKLLEKRARQLVNRKLKDYYTQLLGASAYDAEALLNRAVQMHETRRC